MQERTPERDEQRPLPSTRRGPGERSAEVAPTKRRRSWVDATKGLAICLVVVGHTIRGLFSAQILPSDGAFGYVDRFIYAFHMPLFFFLSGLFVLPPPDERYARFAARRIVRLGYPYLLWATLQTLVQIALSRYTNRPTGVEELWQIAYLPPMQFWFLYALLLQVLFIGLLAKLGLGRGAIFGIALALYLTSPYVPLGSWLPLYQAREALVYTGLGALLGEPGRLRRIESRPARAYVLVALLGFLAVGLAVGFGLEQSHTAALLVACLGSAATISVCCLLERATFPLLEHVRAHLVALGVASLAIFVAHTLASAAVRIGLQKALHVEAAGVHLALGTLAGIYLPLALFRISERLALPYVFEWPTRKTRKPTTTADLRP